MGLQVIKQFQKRYQVLLFPVADFSEGAAATNENFSV
jgi:hypothetical protein